MMLPVNEDGDVRDDALCKDAGFAEQVYVREIRPGRAADASFDVWQVEKYHVRSHHGDVWVCLTAKTDGVLATGRQPSSDSVPSLKDLQYSRLLYSTVYSTAGVSIRNFPESARFPPSGQVFGTCQYRRHD